MIVYGIDLSTYVSKVQVVLTHKRIPYELSAPPDGYNSDAYRRISPLGSIPALVDGDIVLSESEAIVEYLNERFPHPALLPNTAAERARVRMLSRVHDTWVEPQLRRLFPLVRGGTTQGADEAIDNFHMRLGRLSEVASPEPFLGGRQFTLADCAWPTTFVQAERIFPHFGRRVELPTDLREWRQQLDSHESVRGVRARCITGVDEWMRTFAT